MNTLITRIILSQNPFALPPRQHVSTLTSEARPNATETSAHIHCSGCGYEQASTRGDCVKCGLSLAFGW